MLIYSFYLIHFVLLFISSGTLRFQILVWLKEPFTGFFIIIGKSKIFTTLSISFPAQKLQKCLPVITPVLNMFYLCLLNVTLGYHLLGRIFVLFILFSVLHFLFLVEIESNLTSELFLSGRQNTSCRVLSHVFT